MNEQLSGIIDRFLYHNKETGFLVFVLQQTGQSAIVTGQFSSVNPGQEIVVHGNWTTHPKFGKQFQAISYQAVLPSSKQGLIKYLSSGLIKGIGPVYAEKMVKKFGESILEVIETEPDRLKEIIGLGPKRIEQIKNSWQDQKEIAAIMVFLQDKGISPTYAIKIYKKYGSQSITVVQENPYCLASNIWGIGFKIADSIAQNIGFSKHSIARIKAGILHVLTTQSQQGHVYCLLDQLKQLTTELLELNDQSDLIKTALHELYESNEIKLITHDNSHYVTTTILYHTEFSIARKIETLLNYNAQAQIDLDEVYKKLSGSQTSIMLNEDQQRAIMACFQSKVVIITGGPGTGKTTLIKQLLALLDYYRLAYRLAAPTGRAAKRMFEGTGKPAATIHRLLEFDPINKTFVHNEQNALKLDVLIIDEASMLDLFLMHAIVKAMPQAARLVLIGDTDQLPSVGAGNILQDLIASNKISNIRLTHIFRQSQDSLIITNAHRINRGEFPLNALDNCKKDFSFIKEENPDLVIEHIKKIIHFLQKDKIADDCIVLVPMNRGSIGSYVLNQQLQAFFNPDPNNQIMRGGTVFKTSDRVMQIRNNYDKLIFNGDIGFIESITTEDQNVSIRFGDRLIEYSIDELDELVLAYAVSVHKSQGSEYDAVIVPLFMQHFMLLQRNLIYTAVTRAKKRCYIIGQPKALALALKNNKQTTRITLLKQYLTSNLTCR